MKIKSRTFVSVILAILFAVNLFGSIVTNKYKDDDTKQDDIDNQVPLIPDTFLGNLKDDFGVDKEVIKLIEDYNDAYYLSIYTLELQDTKKYFSNDLCALISDTAIRYLVETRKLYDFDFSMNNCRYDLNITDYHVEDNKYYVDLTQDEYLDFAFLEGITSQCFDVDSSFVIEKIDDEYKIADFHKTQGYYLMFDEDIESEAEINDLYDYYFTKFNDQLLYNGVLKQKAEENPFHSDKGYDHSYDRQAAVAYSNLYYHKRNSEWYEYSSTGGNCQNYASQCLLTGGIPMDYFGSQEWKCYSDYLDEDNSPNGRSRSWVAVSYFNEYVENNQGYGLVGENNVNIYYSEPGDIIQVGISTVTHTTIVSRVVNNHVLVNSNSIDMKDYPIEAYTYPKIVLIKILGYND